MSAVAGERLTDRIARLRGGDAFRAYERVRDWVLEIRERYPTAPSAYWTEELETLEHMFDASPLVIDRLRLHTWPVTGIRAYEYRRGKDATRFAEKLAALVELGGEELLVPEPESLGGFGFVVDGRRFNIDTLKYYEVLIALDRAGVLPRLREGRPVVCEIGSGWGGFPYQVKTLFPTVTYVMVDLPELFLYSATYLLSLFPGAKAVFHGEDAAADWGDADFVFVPAGGIDELTPPHMDLMLNMVSFQEMTAAQVSGYARKAWELGSPFLYSLNRETSHYNDELQSVSAELSAWYDLQEIEILPVNYTKMLEDPAKLAARIAKGKEKPRDPRDYKHLVGRRREGA